jgi:hypothetical protein
MRDNTVPFALCAQVLTDLLGRGDALYRSPGKVHSRSEHRIRFPGAPHGNAGTGL